MGFHVLAKHGLNKHGLKDQKLVSFGGETNPYRERGEEKREEEKRKTKKRRGRRRNQDQRYGTNLGMDHMEFVWHSRKF